MIARRDKFDAAGAVADLIIDSAAGIEVHWHDHRGEQVGLVNPFSKASQCGRRAVNARGAPADTC